MKSPFKKGDKVWFTSEGKRIEGTVMRTWRESRYIENSWIARIHVGPTEEDIWQVGAHILHKM